MPTLDELEETWKYESSQSELRVMARGLHPDTVTQEKMRYLMLQWYKEIKLAEETRGF